MSNTLERGKGWRATAETGPIEMIPNILILLLGIIINIPTHIPTEIINYYPPRHNPFPEPT